jgi:hypothetical protein
MVLECLLRKDTQIWENDVLMITGLQAYKTIGDALKQGLIRKTHGKIKVCPSLSWFPPSSPT